MGLEKLVTFLLHMLKSNAYSLDTNPAWFIKVLIKYFLKIGTKLLRESNPLQIINVLEKRNQCIHCVNLI